MFYRQRSERNIGSSSKSPSKRGIYINQQIFKRQKHTPFHSPYKDGRPNKDYVNPTFISSNLFYPNQYLEKKQFSVQKNYVPNQNDMRKQVLYRQRLKTENDQRQRSKMREREVREKAQEKRNLKNINKNKIMRLNEPQKFLNNQLLALKDYRQHLQVINKQKKDIRQDEVPAYFQKSRRDDSYELNRINNNQTQMGNWMAVSNQLKQLKRQLQKTNQALESQKLNKKIQQNHNYVRNQDLKHRKQINLLNGILKQQMKTNEIRKQKKWIY